MPHVRGDGDSDAARLASRIRNTKKLLFLAATIMSFMLIGSSIVTTLLIPAAAFQEGGEANGRALAYIAHRDLGDVFGTVTCDHRRSSGFGCLRDGRSAEPDSAVSAPLRYGTRVGTCESSIGADHHGDRLHRYHPLRCRCQSAGSGLPTGVLVLFASVAFAATISTPRRRVAFGLVFAVFVYTTASNIIERPEGLTIALWFIAGMVVTSLVSRVMRSTELRARGVRYDADAERFVVAAKGTPLTIIANRPDSGLPDEYESKLKEARQAHHMPPDAHVVFLEIYPSDASAFANELTVSGRVVGRHQVLATHESSRAKRHRGNSARSP